MTKRELLAALEKYDDADYVVIHVRCGESERGMDVYRSLSLQAVKYLTQPPGSPGVVWLQADNDNLDIAVARLEKKPCPDIVAVNRMFHEWLLEAAKAAKAVKASPEEPDLPPDIIVGAVLQ